jgi:hypothetical protein
MGFFNMDKAGNLPEYSEFIDQNLVLRTFGDDSRDAYEFMVSFNKLGEDVTDVTC